MRRCVKIIAIIFFVGAANQCSTSYGLSTAQTEDGKKPTVVFSDPFHPSPAELAVVARAIKDRVACMVAPLLNGKVLIAGGNPGSFEGGFLYPSNEGAFNGHVAYLVTAELYDPATDRMTMTGALSVPRAGAMATLLPDGKVLIAGGENWVYTPESYTSAEIYDPLSGRFAPTGEMLEPREYATAVLLKTGQVLVAGGYHMDAKGLRLGGLVTAEIYDPASGAFRPTGNMSTVRSMYCMGCQPAASILQDGRVLIAGGINTDGDVLNSAEIYDPSAGTFAPTGSMRASRLSASATLLPDGRVRINDGAYHRLYGKGMVHPGFIQAVMMPEFYSPATGTFSLQ
jgi:hypothetical protein